MKFLALWFTYTAIIILFPLPLIVFLFTGMLETVRATPPSPPGPDADESNNQSN